MVAVCLFVAGVVRATLPAAEFTLAWEHSVQKTRWEEHYRIDGDDLVLVEARVAGTGAGMEPPASATLRGGVWTWRPRIRLPEIRLTHSGYTRDYTLCWRGGCRELSALAGPVEDGASIVVRRCGQRPLVSRPPTARAAEERVE
jgi:hypothetical protein